MNKLNIGTRLTLSFVFLLLLIAIIASVGAWRIQASTAMTEEVIDRRLAVERLIARWSRATGENAVRTLAVGTSGANSGLDHFHAAIARTSTTIENIKSELVPLLTDPVEFELLQTVEDVQAHYLSRRNEAMKAQASGDLGAAQRFFYGELEGLLNDYTASVDALLVHTRASINEQAAILQENNSRGLIILIAVATIALLAGVILAFGITRSITVPLRRAVAVAETVSERDLTARIDAHGRDETSQLLRALKTMNENLMEVVGEVRDSAGSIATASRQIAAGNIDLSSRTEEQASSLAETAATMDQLTSTVRQNADHANQASGLANSAAEVAEQSSDVVTRVVGTMEAISESSKQIVEIIDVIDSIAFQTNILALNAAVEAARAGDQGRGFAVVASEVRALAQRSASAAREIKTLIDTSVSTTEEGNKLVAEAGVHMQETVASIQRVTSIMREIAHASQEQSVGIEQVNQAMAQMDQVTQQNAALVEEATAAADSMQNQSTGLARLVGTFRIDHQKTDAGSTDNEPHVDEAADKKLRLANAPQALEWAA